jgi:excisionase family DNA binding protein
VTLTPNMADDRYITVKEAAKILGVSKMTVYRLCDADELFHVRVGRSIRISERVLSAYIAQGGNTAPLR